MAISLLTDSELIQIPQNLRPTKTIITIASHNAHSHSKAYASSIDCPTILHEVLHLLGLCDEYPGEVDNYPCRAVGARDNVMRNQRLAFSNGLTENVRCEFKTDECQQVINDPLKRDLIVSPNFYDIIPWEFRNSFCEFDPGFFKKNIESPEISYTAYSAHLNLRIHSELLLL